jgi:nucleoside-triphosphatase
LLLTGPPGIGKSTIVERVVDRLRTVGVPVGGFITRELREGQQRVGFVVDALDGANAVLAHVSFAAGPKVGRYRVDIAAFDRLAVPALHRGVQRRDLLVIDEIGRMELASTAFVEGLQTILESPASLLATVHQVAHPVTDKLIQRPDVEVWTVRQDNRDALTDRLSTRLITAWQANEQGSR